MAAAATPAYVQASLSKVSDGTGHGTPNQTFVNAANGFEVGDNSPDDGVVSSGDLVLYRLDLRFTAASARTVRVRWDLADAPYLEGGTEFCYSGAQVTASVQDDGSCVFTVPAGVAESVSRQIVLRGRDTGARVVDGQQARLWVERVSLARNGSWVADGEKQMRPADPVTVVSAPAADLVVRDYEPKGAERRSSWTGEGADASATGYVDLDVVPLAYPGWSSHGASTGGKWQASVNVGAFPEETTWRLTAGSGDDSSSWPLTVTDGMLRLPRISGDARLEWTLPASVLTDDWERGATRTFDIQVIPDEDAFAADDAHLLNLGTGGEPGRAQGRDVDSRNDDYGSLTGYPYPNNDWSRAIVVRPGDGDSMSGKLITRPWTRGTTLFDTASMEFAAAVSPQGEPREEEVMPVDTLTYTLTPSVRDVMLSGTAITPEIRIPLPQGLTEPVLDSGQWTIEMQDGAGGKELVFRPASADGKTTPQVGLTGVADLPPIVWHARVGNRATGVIQVTAGFTANLDANGAVPARSAARSAAQQSTPIAGNRIQGARFAGHTRHRSHGAGRRPRIRTQRDPCGWRPGCRARVHAARRGGAGRARGAAGRCRRAAAPQIDRGGAGPAWACAGRPARRLTPGRSGLRER